MVAGLLACVSQNQMRVYDYIGQWLYWFKILCGRPAKSGHKIATAAPNVQGDSGLFDLCLLQWLFRQFHFASTLFVH